MDHKTFFCRDYTDFLLVSNELSRGFINEYGSASRFLLTQNLLFVVRAQSGILAMGLVKTNFHAYGSVVWKCPVQTA